MLFAKLQFLVLNAKFYGMTKVISLPIGFMKILCEEL